MEDLLFLLTSQGRQLFELGMKNELKSLISGTEMRLCRGVTT